MTTTTTTTTTKGTTTTTTIKIGEDTYQIPIHDGGDLQIKIKPDWKIGSKRPTPTGFTRGTNLVRYTPEQTITKISKETTIRYFISYLPDSKGKIETKIHRTTGDHYKILIANDGNPLHILVNRIGDSKGTLATPLYLKIKDLPPKLLKRLGTKITKDKGTTTTKDKGTTTTEDKGTTTTGDKGTTSKGTTTTTD